MAFEINLRWLLMTKVDFTWGIVIADPFAHQSLLGRKLDFACVYNLYSRLSWKKQITQDLLWDFFPNCVPWWLVQEVNRAISNPHGIYWRKSFGSDDPISRLLFIFLHYISIEEMYLLNIFWVRLSASVYTQPILWKSRTEVLRVHNDIHTISSLFPKCCFLFVTF